MTNTAATIATIINTRLPCAFEAAAAAASWAFAAASSLGVASPAGAVGLSAAGSPSAGPAARSEAAASESAEAESVASESFESGAALLAVVVSVWACAAIGANADHAASAIASQITPAVHDGRRSVRSANMPKSPWEGRWENCFRGRSIQIALPTAFADYLFSDFDDLPPSAVSTSPRWIEPKVMRSLAP